MRYSMCLILLLMFSMDTMRGIMSAIVTNTNSKVFAEAGKEAIVDYRFGEREILFIEAITNIDGREWYYFKKRYYDYKSRPKQVRGWIVGEFGILYKNDIINTIISNEIYKDYKDVCSLFEAKVVDYGNNYYSLFFQIGWVFDGEQRFSLYFHENGRLKKVVESYTIDKNVEVAFVGNFIVVEDGESVEVYNSNEWEDTNKKYYKRTFHIYRWRLTDKEISSETLEKTRLKFDKKSGVLTVSVTYKSGGKREFKYIFTNGVFVALTNR